jgi:hypothetical protein
MQDDMNVVLGKEREFKKRSGGRKKYRYDIEGMKGSRECEGTERDKNGKWISGDRQVNKMEALEKKESRSCGENEHVFEILTGSWVGKRKCDEGDVEDEGRKKVKLMA